MARDFGTLLQFLPDTLDHFRDDYNTLYRCSLVNRLFNQLASRLLYTRVVLSPPFRPFLNLRDKYGLSMSGLFTSAVLPHNAANVLIFDVRGFLSPRPPPLNPLGVKLHSAVLSFTRLQSVTLTPTTFHEDIFTDVLHALKNCHSLSSLSVNPACLDETRAPILARLDGLKILTLVDPTRAILQILPEWLSRLSKTLTELHLVANCGSITPGVLRSFIPHLQHIHTFSLGLSYSLTDENVFSFLSELPELRSIQVHYHLQLKWPAVMPLLLNLRSFTVSYSPMETRDEVNRFCRWIRRAISSSPLEHLCLSCNNDNIPLKVGASVNFDGLVEHIVKRHSHTIRFLNLKSAFVGVDAFQHLCAECVYLEEFVIAVSSQTLLSFPDFAPSLHKLHTVSFEIRNIKRSHLAVYTRQAASLLERGPPSLRRVAINGVHWEGSWISKGQSSAEFIALPVTQGTAPWERDVH